VLPGLLPRTPELLIGYGGRLAQIGAVINRCLLRLALRYRIPPGTGEGTKIDPHHPANRLSWMS